MRGECLPTNGKRGGLASTSPQAETAGGESCSFSGFNDYHGHEEDDNEDGHDDEEEGGDDACSRNGEGGNYFKMILIRYKRGCSPICPQWSAFD